MLKKATVFSPLQDVEPVMNLKQKILHMILGDFPAKRTYLSLTVKATHVVFGCPPQSPCYMRKSCFLVMQGFSNFLGLF